MGDSTGEGKERFFADYYTCAFVRIQGGRPLADSYKPRFVAGKNHLPGVPKGKCVSTSQWIGQCGGLQCDGKPVIISIPGEFWSGRRPRTVYSRAIGYVGRGRINKFGTVEEELKAEEKSKQEEKLDRFHGNQIEQERLRIQRKRQREHADRLRKQKLYQERLKKLEKKRIEEKRRKQQRILQMQRERIRREKLRRERLRKEKLVKERRRKEYLRKLRAKNGGKVPQKPTAAWGPKGSPLWWHMRSKFWDWKNYCSVEPHSGCS